MDPDLIYMLRGRGWVGWGGGERVSLLIWKWIWTSEKVSVESLDIVVQQTAVPAPSSLGKAWFFQSAYVGLSMWLTLAHGVCGKKWHVLIISTGFKVHWCLHQPSCCLLFYLGMSLDQRGYCFRLGTRWVDTWKRPAVPFKSCRARNPLRLGVLRRIRWDKHLTNKQEHSFIHSINVSPAATTYQALQSWEIEQCPPLLSCSGGRREENS